MKDTIKLFDCNIDVEQTQKKGEKVCEDYAPLLQKRLKLLNKSLISCGSLIQVGNDSKSRNGTEIGYFNRLALEDDQVARFMKLIDDVIKIDLHAGKFLKYRYLDENSIQEIAERLGISRRTVYNIMPRAYYYVAEWSHNVVFIVKKTYSFHLKTENLYNKLS